MEHEWITIYDQLVNGRPVKIERYFEGGYRATTTALKDFPGNLDQTDCEALIMAPDGAGYEVGWEDENIQVLCNGFLDQYFSGSDVQLMYDACINNSKLPL